MQKTDDERKRRLADALRANLRKRKEHRPGPEAEANEREGNQATS
jgi:hypothetical protein